MQLTLRRSKILGDVYIYVDTTRPKTGVSGHRVQKWIDALKYGYTLRITVNDVNVFTEHII